MSLDLSALDLSALDGKAIAVLGLGKTGLSVYNALTQQPDITCYAYDDKHHDQQTDLTNLDHLDYLVVSPGVAPSHPIIMALQAKNIAIVTDVDLFCLCYPASYKIAITGSNGKSTTTDLIAYSLHQLGTLATPCGNIGTPMFDLTHQQACATLVMELSSYQLEYIAQSPCHTECDQTILLNISPDHLERHKTLENYCRAKANIFHHLKPTGHAIIGGDDAHCLDIASKLQVPFDMISGYPANGRAIGYQDNMIMYYDGRDIYTIPCQDMILKGYHNYQNLAATYACLHHLDHDYDSIIRAISSYAGMQHRQEYIGNYGTHVFINDSKATNSDATKHALQTYDDIIWIMGGAIKDGSDYNELLQYAERITSLYIYGKDRDIFYNIFKSINDKINVMSEDNLDAIIPHIMTSLHQPNTPKTILLSPACASFDQFNSFEHRGEYFTQLCHQHGVIKK